MAIGRISGPLLKSNLIRDGVDLAFETDLLYLDVNNARIGINSAAPDYELDVVGTTRTTDLDVTNTLTIGNFTVTGNSISSNLDTISFIPSGAEPTIYHSRLQVGDIEIDNNVISTTVSNSNLELRTNGTGIVDIFSTTNITGDLTVTGTINVTGNVKIDGNIQIGDSLDDTIVINAKINSDLVPQASNTYDLGSSAFRWQAIYAVNLYSDQLNATQLDVGQLTFTDNVVSTVAGQDLILDPNGAGRVRLGNFAIFENTITNIIPDAVSILSQSGTGYFKIAGTNGFVPPSGTVSQRPVGFDRVIGMTRYNTESKALEIWDGLGWQSPAGSIGAVSEGTANEIAVQYALTLG